MPAALRILLGWLLLAVLLVAGASYLQGSRYALVAEPGPALSAVQHAAATHSSGPLNALAGADLRHPASSVHAADGHHASCPGDSPQHACCDRYPASRSEPAPAKAAAPPPPAAAVAAGPQHVLPAAQEPEPQRQALTLDQLSISRT